MKKPWIWISALLALPLSALAEEAAPAFSGSTLALVLEIAAVIVLAILLLRSWKKDRKK